MTAHVAVVFTRYMLLAVEQRQNINQRTIGDLFLPDGAGAYPICHIMKHSAVSRDNSQTSFSSMLCWMNRQYKKCWISSWSNCQKCGLRTYVNVHDVDLFCGQQADSIRHIGHLPCAKFE